MRNNRQGLIANDYGSQLLGALILLLTIPTVHAIGFLHFKPEKGATIPSNHFIVVNGTSSPLNATYTKCNAMLKTNGHPYQPVTYAPQTSKIAW